MRSETSQFMDAIADAGLTPPSDVVADGKLHRFASNGRKRDAAGWYVFHPGDMPAGAFGDWRSGTSAKWRARIDRARSPADKEKIRARIWDERRQREGDDRARKLAAKVKAEQIWEESDAARPDHPYLVAKGIEPHGLRQHYDDLIVPMTDNGVLWSLQFIAPDGRKKFLFGGRVAGCYHLIGNPVCTLCIAEGFSTAASIHQATRYAVAVAFNAGNLVPVATTLRDRFPISSIVCADDDWATHGNPGLTQARRAALETGGHLAVPEFTEPRAEKATDFNDMAALVGASAVAACVRQALREGGK